MVVSGKYFGLTQEPGLVFVVGTIHVSEDSADAVTQVIECVKPDNVVVELCRSRSGMLYIEEADFKEASSDAGKTVVRNVQLERTRQILQNALKGGSVSFAALVQLLLNQAFGKMQAKMGVISGMEMRAARAAAEAVDAQLVLGDRPIEITWERTWSQLTLKKRWQLLSQLLGLVTRPLPAFDMADIERLGGDDVIEAMTQHMFAEDPQVASALLHERDLYLAWSLKRSKAVNGCETVVGVIGRAHLRGVVYHLMQESSNLRFRDLVSSSKSRRRGKQAFPAWAKFIAENLLLAAGLDFAWQLVSRQQKPWP